MRCAVWTIAVDIVEVELRGPVIDQLVIAGDLTAKPAGGIERNIMIDELPEECVAGRSFGIAGGVAGFAFLDHRPAQCYQGAGIVI